MVYNNLQKIDRSTEKRDMVLMFLLYVITLLSSLTAILSKVLFQTIAQGRMKVSVQKTFRSHLVCIHIQSLDQIATIAQVIARQAPEAIVAAINDRFDIQVQPIIHRMTEERVVLSFPDHWESVQAFRLASKGTTLYINGVPYRFTIDFLQSHLMKVRSDQRITLYLKGLPPCLRSDATIVE